MPDSYNRHRQKYCSNPKCRLSSKKASQARWLSKKRNWGYFRGPDNTARVREWREQHPGYWRRHRRSAPVRPPLQETALAPTPVYDERRLQLTFNALQVFVMRLKLMLEGYIARMLGGTAQKEAFGSVIADSYLMGRTIYGV